MPEFAKLGRWFRDDETHFVELTRCFFGRFFDAELISEAQLDITYILALLALPGLFYAIFAFFVYSYIYWHFTQALYDAVSISDQCRYLLFSMAVIGLLAVLEWDALFPDRRDYAVLTPLPLRLRTIFGAKITALLLFVGLFILTVAGLPVVFYPLMAVWGINPGTSLQHFVWMMAVHGIAVFSGCAFMVLLFVALQGVLINLLSGTQFKKVSLYVQGLATVALICLLFLLPMIPSLLPRWERSHSRLLFALPPMWFLGLYQTLLGSHDSLFLSLARFSIVAFVLSAGIAAAAYFACYRRYSQMAFESPVKGKAWFFKIGTPVSRLFDRLALSEHLERATFYFTLKTLARSAKHRLYFAIYVAVGLGLVLVGILKMLVHSAHGNLWAMASQPGAELLSIPLVVSFFMLSGMRIVFEFPAELPANWIFQITDGSNGRICLAGARKAVVAVAIAPVCVLMFVIYGLMWGFVASALTVLFATLLSLILMEILLYAFRKIPFACSYIPGKANLLVLGLVYWLAFTFYAYSMASLEKWMFHKPLIWVVAFGAEALILERIIALRNRFFANGFAFQYEDIPLVAIQSLHLNT